MLVLDFYTGFPSSTHMAEIVNNDPPGVVVHKINVLCCAYCIFSLVPVVFAVLCICCVVHVEKPNISYLIKDFLYPLKPFLI